MSWVASPARPQGLTQSSAQSPRPQVVQQPPKAGGLHAASCHSSSTELFISGKDYALQITRTILPITDDPSPLCSNLVYGTDAWRMNSRVGGVVQNRKKQHTFRKHPEREKKCQLNKNFPFIERYRTTTLWGVALLFPLKASLWVPGGEEGGAQVSSTECPAPTVTPRNTTNQGCVTARQCTCSKDFIAEESIFKII